MRKSGGREKPRRRQNAHGIRSVRCGPVPARQAAKEAKVSSYSSTTVLSAAFLRTDSMPFKQLAMAL